ncbi:hypothetical protein INR49_032275 [Caranx melampygus]|nr:hypothetical protein INR49_032275 [Caranx melampygus]
MCVSQREELKNDTSPAQRAGNPAFLHCAASFPPQWEKKRQRVSPPAERKSDSDQAQCTTRALWAQEEPGSGHATYFS